MLAAVAFLDAFQKVADMATNTRGGEGTRPNLDLHSEQLSGCEPERTRGQRRDLGSCWLMEQAFWREGASHHWAGAGDRRQGGSRVGEGSARGVCLAAR